VFLVLILSGFLYLRVSLARRFEGRLWMLPSRVFSDVLMIAPGDPLEIGDLAGRLDRSGYARVSRVPDHPGQYRREGPVLDVYLRSFEAVGLARVARRLRLGFEPDRVGSIEDTHGRALPRVALEPELLATLFGPRQEERLPVALDTLPLHLTQAVLAAEDSRFFSHPGIDWRGVLRATWANLRSREIVQGGSTITQQTVKNIFLGHERTWWRKAREGLMSLMLDSRYSKRRILEVYLNEVYLGQRGPVAVCGVKAAARFYFGRDVEDLSLGESALLAGLIRSPGRYNPFTHRERALARREIVLAAMLRLEMLTAEQTEAARREPIELARGSDDAFRAPYAVDFVRAQLAQSYSSEILERDGLQIYTTLNTVWQQHAEQALRSGLERLERQVGPRTGEPLQGAVLVTDPRTGAILALVGGRDYASSQFNRATQARRQPGSCFKPFVYAAGFEQATRGEGFGLTPASLLEDSPLEMDLGSGSWSPQNYDGEYRGWVTVRAALVSSLNVPTVRAAQGVGLANVIEISRRLGIASPLRPVPSLALGALEVTPLELANAYGTLARLGQRGRPWVVRQIVDADGEVLARSGPGLFPGISPQAAYLVNHVLRGVLREGTARSAASLGYRGNAAGKTGTTDDTRDAWFVGYTSEILSLVWVGYDDNRETHLTGATGALPIWVDIMRRGGAWSRSGPQPVPPGIVERRIDPESGGLVRRGCPGWIDERFAAGSEPTRQCVLHGNRFRRWFQKLRRK
jgi:penicillin-binding protein 1B